MARLPSLSAVRATLRETAPGMTIRKDDCGEYRVTFTLDAIAAVFPAMSRVELIAKAESLASYDSDITGAYETAKSMFRTGLQPEIVSAPVETDAALVAEYVEAAAASGDPWHIANAAEHVATLADGGLYDADATRCGIEQARAIVPVLAPVEVAPAITIARVEEMRARHAREDALANRHQRLGAVWKARLDVENGTSANDGDWKFVGTHLHAIYCAAHVRYSRFKLHTFVERETVRAAQVAWLSSLSESDMVALENEELAPTLALAAMTADAARLAGATLDSPPVAERGGVRTDDSGRQFIDMTPTWAEILPTLLALVTDGDSKGQAFAREELARACQMADKFTAARKAFASVEAR